MVQIEDAIIIRCSFNLIFRMRVIFRKIQLIFSLKIYSSHLKLKTLKNFFLVCKLCYKNVTIYDYFTWKFHNRQKLPSIFIIIKDKTKSFIFSNICTLCLVLLHEQNIFYLEQNLNCPAQFFFVQDKIFCLGLKSSFLLLKSP